MTTEFQKAFTPGVAGCMEHQEKLWKTLVDAQYNQKSVNVCWIDLANAYGSVSHNLIHFALKHYNAASPFQNIVNNFYTNPSATIITKEWSTNVFRFLLVFFKGILFQICFTTQL